jgi:hypothetical protein
MTAARLNKCDEENCYDDDTICAGGYHVSEDDLDIVEDVSIDGCDFSGDTRAILGHIGNHYFKFSDWFGWDYAGKFTTYEDAVPHFEQFAHLPDGWQGDGSITLTVIDQCDECDFEEDDNND